MFQDLVAGGKHSITCLTRPDSTSTFPAGSTVVKVDYNDHDQLVAALRGHDALVITLSVTSPPDLHSRLVKAAADAGVPWVVPNDWGVDSNDAGLQADLPLFKVKEAARAEIVALGKSSYLSVATGFWYEWSLAVPFMFGFDFANKAVTFFDDGETKMTLSTWPQVGRAVAALLSLPIKPEGGNEQRCLERFRNRAINVGSFTVSQKDMFESALRVTGTKREDWTISYESSRERFDMGAEGVKTGDRKSFAIMLYSRLFFPAGEIGNSEKRQGLANDVLGLSKDDIDVATAAAIERSKNPPF